MNPRAASESGMVIDRAEQVFVALTLVAMFVLPMIRREPYPLTSAPMYCRPMKEFRVYALLDARGQSLNWDEYGLRTSLSWYQEENFGVIYPPSLVSPPDKPADMGRVIERVRRIGRRDHAKFPLLLRCEVTGPRDDQTIGRLQVQEWTITDRKEPAGGR